MTQRVDEVSSPLRAEQLSASYEQRRIIDQLDLDIPAGKITAVIGPNACGKSTLLRTVSRLLKPDSGQVVLNGRNIAEYSTKEVARQLGLLPQSSLAPGGITVGDLVARGRFPHQRALQQWSIEDEEKVALALRDTHLQELADRPVDELSGGQRQRVWIALVLAQDTDLLLLDEPTTFLDISHQLDVLQLCRRLNRERGRTVVLVLHELNQACRFADHLVVMSEGRVVAAGAPKAIISEPLIEQVYGLSCRVLPDPVFGTPMIIPIGSLITDPITPAARETTP
ncbi:ABC transporter ATP-binding protein [Nesterenkonia alba]|uniref:ABC transporter ATP-binding protein n=1 Tax=Nesterenkonia alba TaxID=515814 RepID=UPI0003B31145|nr:ABC transporter ATP-binding protein [Nesterenkonia alba]